MAEIIPTYSQGFARYKAQSAYPHLWDGLVGLWSPPLGPTGLTLKNWAGPGDGTLTNMDTGDWVTSEKGYVLDYDGVNDFVDLTYGQGIDPSSNPHSFCLWVKTDLSIADQIFLSTGQSGSDRMYIGRSATSSNGEWGIGIQASAWNNVPQGIAATTEWTYLSLVMDGSTATLYVDAWQSTQKAYTSYSFLQNIDIARHPTAPGLLEIKGQIGDVSIYNRALDANEISAMYAGASPLILKRRTYASVAVSGLLLRQSNMQGGLQQLNGGLM